MCCQLRFAGLLDEKVFLLRLSSLCSKILFHPAGSLSFSYCLLSFLALSCQYTNSLADCRCRTAWAWIPCHPEASGLQIKREVEWRKVLLRCKLVVDRHYHICGLLSNRSRNFVVVPVGICGLPKSYFRDCFWRKLFAVNELPVKERYVFVK